MDVPTKVAYRYLNDGSQNNKKKVDVYAQRICH